MRGHHLDSGTAKTTRRATFFFNLAVFPPVSCTKASCLFTAGASFSSGPVCCVVLFIPPLCGRGGHSTTGCGTLLIPWPPFPMDARHRTATQLGTGRTGSPGWEGVIRRQSPPGASRRGHSSRNRAEVTGGGHWLKWRRNYSKINNNCSINKIMQINKGVGGHISPCGLEIASQQKKRWG